LYGLEKITAVQMIDVHLPTTDGRELLVTRYTHPVPELLLLIQRLKFQLPHKRPPKIATASVAHAPVVRTFRSNSLLAMSEASLKTAHREDG
jgi:hypothetical protein